MEKKENRVNFRPLFGLHVKKYSWARILKSQKDFMPSKLRRRRVSFVLPAAARCDEVCRLSPFIISIKNLRNLKIENDLWFILCFLSKETLFLMLQNSKLHHRNSSFLGLCCNVVKSLPFRRLREPSGFECLRKFSKEVRVRDDVGCCIFRNMASSTGEEW